MELTFKLNDNRDGLVITSAKGIKGAMIIPSEQELEGRTLPVTGINAYAFHGCSKMTSVSIPKSVTEIGDNAFEKCSRLASAVISEHVTKIGEGIFNNCPNLFFVAVKAGNKHYDSRNNCNGIIETGTNTLVAGCLSTTIPDSVTTIGPCAFWGCTSRTSIVIPNSVTEIGWGAFYGCTALTSIVLSDSLTKISDWAFERCHGLSSIAIPDSVTEIGWFAFHSCLNLASVTISNPATTIGRDAFQNTKMICINTHSDYRNAA